MFVSRTLNYFDTTFCSGITRLYNLLIFAPFMCKCGLKCNLCFNSYVSRYNREKACGVLTHLNKKYFTGLAKIRMAQCNREKNQKIMNCCSIFKQKFLLQKIVLIISILCELANNSNVCHLVKNERF